MDSPPLSLLQPRFKQNAVRLQPFALTYNLANFMGTLALPKEIQHLLLTTLRENVDKYVMNHYTLERSQVIRPRRTIEID
ncbi:MAG: hypothetical protein HQL68_01725 [Magnetococcales bacterium]|nr:hypothetical protein [Magnetococcales bacterium]